MLGDLGKANGTECNSNNFEINTGNYDFSSVLSCNHSRQFSRSPSQPSFEAEASRNALDGKLRDDPK